jgi:hypothetical protein
MCRYVCQPWPGADVKEPAQGQLREATRRCHTEPSAHGDTRNPSPPKPLQNRHRHQRQHRNNTHTRTSFSTQSLCLARSLPAGVLASGGLGRPCLRSWRRVCGGGAHFDETMAMIGLGTYTRKLRRGRRHHTLINCSTSRSVRRPSFFDSLQEATGPESSTIYQHRKIEMHQSRYSHFHHRRAR